jgi:hypothetical protein
MGGGGIGEEEGGGRKGIGGRDADLAAGCGRAARGEGCDNEARGGAALAEAAIGESAVWAGGGEGRGGTGVRVRGQLRPGVVNRDGGMICGVLYSRCRVGVDVDGGGWP